MHAAGVVNHTVVFCGYCGTLLHMPSQVDRALEAASTLVANPFEVSVPQRAQSEMQLMRAGAAEVAEALVRSGRPERVAAVALAAAEMEGARGGARPLPERAWPAALFKAVPAGRSGCLRMGLAAWRCRKALTDLSGSSSGLQRVRREAWGACFGASLEHALPMERLIRDHDVLILGETGTGKELVARAVLQAVPGGADGGLAPSSTVNAAAIPDTLLEGELFGYSRGAFTGASQARTGRIRSAHNGCFFLDEAGDLPLTTQVKLLRVIEADEVHPLGSDTVHHVDVRFVAATHRDLLVMVEAGQFRRDLYERLAGAVIRVPPLRERVEDIVDIGLAFMKAHLGDPLPSQTDRVASWLRSPQAAGRQWMGNVRELYNVLRSMLLGLPPPAAETAAVQAQGAPPVPAPILHGSASMDDVTRWYVGHALSAHGGNVAQTARTLAVDRGTIRRWTTRRTSRGK